MRRSLPVRKRYGVILVAGALVALAGAASLSAREAAPQVAKPAVLAPTARWDDVAKPDPAGDVKAKGLTPRERRAIDIVRVEATGDTFGAIVTVTFARSFEAAVGLGRLSGAVAGIVLRPRSGRPTVVATLGPGVRGDDGGGLGGRGPFVVVRQGRKVTFIARNFDFTKINRLEAKTFSALARTRRTTQSSSFNPEIYTAIASRPGEDFWAAENRDFPDFEDDSETHCKNLRAKLAETRRELSEVTAEVRRARDNGRNATATRLAADALKVDQTVRELEKAVAARCKPPVEDYGCQGEAQKHPTAAGHHNIALGLCKRTIDRVEITTSAPFQRIDSQGIVVDTTARTFRVVPVTASSDRALAVAIQPPMQPVEFLQVTVQGLPSGTLVEVTPFAAGIKGQSSRLTIS